MSVKAQQTHVCLFNSLFRPTAQKRLKIWITTICEGNHRWIHKGPLVWKAFLKPCYIYHTLEQWWDCSGTDDGGMKDMISTITAKTQWTSSICENWAWFLCCTARRSRYKLGSDNCEFHNGTIISLYWCIKVNNIYFLTDMCFVAKLNNTMKWPACIYITELILQVRFYPEW